MRRGVFQVGSLTTFALALLLGDATVLEAKGGKPGGKPGGAPADLRGAPIKDVPTSVPVPMSKDRTLVLNLPAAFWIRCPRHLLAPNSLAGDGIVVHYLNPRGGSLSLLYAGRVPLAEASDTDPAEARVRRTAEEFAANLAPHYARLDWRLSGAPVALQPTTIQVDGKKIPAFRTAKYTTRPNEYAGMESVFTGECVLFRPEGTDVLAYVALDAKSGGTTLDRVLERVEMRSPRDVAAKGRRLQLNDYAPSLDPSRFAVRLFAFDLPAGFSPTVSLYEEKGESVYIEERLDASGAPCTRLRIHQRHAQGARTVQQDCDDARGYFAPDQVGPCEEVPLASKGHVAFVFAHPAPGRPPEVRAHTAVLRLDDQIVQFTWTPCADGAQAERDKADLAALLRTVELAVRW